MEKIGMLHKAWFALVLIMVAGVSNASIVRTYDDPTGSGIVTYTDLGGGMLQIMFDNTSGADYSSLITGLAFDVVDDIDAVSSFSFVDGNGTDIAAYYGLDLDVNSSFVGGNTLIDVEFGTINGANGGIYNDAANAGGFSSDMFPDIAILTLAITAPEDWALSSISNDFLRMQQTGLDGEESLKLPGAPVVPVPAAVWLFGSGMLGLIGVARRKNRA